jgi:hypothetical protein
VNAAAAAAARRVALAAAPLVLLMISGCASPRAPGRVSPLDWTNVRRRLVAIRATASVRPYTAIVRCALREPATGHVYHARGALAVQPDSAMRMVLVGPAGATALDLWVTRDKWRIVVPGADYKKVGSPGHEDTRGLPIGFFRWWFLSPLAGRLLTTAEAAGGPSFVLRDGGGVVEVRQVDGSGRSRGKLHLVALRREGGAVEAVEWLGQGLAPRAGDRGRYLQDSSGLEVEVVIDAIAPDEPDPAAFFDPDEHGVAL